jgi:hypothetical protein
MLPITRAERSRLSRVNGMAAAGWDVVRGMVCEVYQKKMDWLGITHSLRN